MNIETGPPLGVCWAEVLLDIADRLKRLDKEGLLAVAQGKTPKQRAVMNLALRLERQPAEYKRRAVAEKLGMGELCRDLTAESPRSVT